MDVTRNYFWQKALKIPILWENEKHTVQLPSAKTDVMAAPGRAFLEPNMLLWSNFQGILNKLMKNSQF